MRFPGAVHRFIAGLAYSVSALGVGFSLLALSRSSLLLQAGSDVTMSIGATGAALVVGGTAAVLGEIRSFFAAFPPPPTPSPPTISPDPTSAPIAAAAATSEMVAADAAFQRLEHP